jgi:hypothetical protein
MAIIRNAQQVARGAGEVDGQHKELFRHFTELPEAMAHSKGHATAICLLIQLRGSVAPGR